MKLLIASHNSAKVGEYKRYLSDLNLGLVSLADLKITEEAPEDGQTFEENAISKVKFYNELTGLAVIADDGGLTIDALNGEPGVKSRRWLGHVMTDEELIEEVMKRMKDVPEGKRACHLVGIIALALSQDEIHTTWAQIDGIVAEKPTEKRQPGFPYRSFFWLPQFKKFYINLTDEEHERVNHRKFSLLKLKNFLQ